MMEIFLQKERVRDSFKYSDWEIQNIKNLMSEREERNFKIDQILEVLKENTFTIIRENSLIVDITKNIIYEYL